jgi:acetolactate synthase regulatory subunit
MSDHDEAYDRLLTVLFERGFVHTHIEMAMVFRAVRARAGV